MKVIYKICDKTAGEIVETTSAEATFNYVEGMLYGHHKFEVSYEFEEEEADNE